MVNLALLAGMSSRKTAVLTVLLTAGMAYSNDVDAIVIIKERVQEESVLILSNFIKYNKKDKLKFIKAIKLELLLKDVLPQAKVKQYINMCLNNNNKLLQILSRVKLQYVAPNKDIFKEVVSTVLHGDKYPVIALNDFGKTLSDYKYKIQDFISKYAFVITTVQNSEHKVLVVESIQGRAKPNEKQYMKKIARFLASRSNIMLTISDKIEL